jgi:hypothetical protein
VRLHWRSVLAVAVLLAMSQDCIGGQSFALRPDKSVEVLTIGPLKFSEGGTALWLTYRTALSLDDVPTLRKEVGEIWNRFVVDVERAGFQSAVISANEPPKGVIITKTSSYNFIFEKKDGSWRTHESKERAQAKLDPEFVKEFVDRLDWAFLHDNMNVLLLHMANDWTVTITNPNESSSTPQIIDRTKFVATSHAGLVSSSNVQHHRDILHIAVSDDRTVARLESRETADAIIGDRQISEIERVTDTFELNGNTMLWTKSESVIERRTEIRSN